MLQTESEELARLRNELATIQRQPLEECEQLRDQLAEANRRAEENLLIDKVTIAPWALVTPDNCDEYEASLDGSKTWYAIRSRWERDVNAQDVGCSRLVFGIKNGTGGTWRRATVGELNIAEIRRIRDFVGFKGPVVGTQKPLAWDNREVPDCYVLIKVTREQERITRLALSRGVIVDAVVAEVRK
jgi:hypothetical protein